MFQSTHNRLSALSPVLKGVRHQMSTEVSFIQDTTKPATSYKFEVTDKCIFKAGNGMFFNFLNPGIDPPLFISFLRVLFCENPELIL